MKPCTKQKVFSLRSLARGQHKNSSSAAGEIDSQFVPVDFLDRISCFETVRVYRSQIFLWKQHFERFMESCRGLGYVFPWSEAEIKDWLDRCIEDSGQGNSLLRVALHNAPKNDPRLVIYLRPFSSHSEEWYKNGIPMVTSSVRRGPLKAQNSQLKVSQYVNGVLAMLDMGENKLYEILFMGTDDTIAEGSTSNVFVVKENVVLTPKVASGILKGVTREFVLRLIRESGLSVKETFLTRHDLYSADECFITNTSSEVLPVTEIDGRKIGEGMPGHVAKNLRKKFQEQLKTGL